jgi:hypothetical protein
MQETIVAFIVLAALWKVVARYAPKSVSHAMHRVLLGLLRRLGLARLAERLAASKQAAAGGACGDCGGCSPAAGKAQAKAGEPQRPAEFSITPEQLRRTARR